MFDLTQGIQGGLIRGVGLQGWAFIIAFVCYYIIGIPLAVLLTFKANLGLKGTWIGVAICSVCVNISFGILLIKKEWKSL